MFPILINLTGRLVVVVGLGSVGTRRAVAAMRAGAVLRVIEPHPTRSVCELGPVATLVPEPYAPEHLEGACLVFACGPSDVNARVVADCRSRGILVNSASDPESADFIVPSVMRRGTLTIAVSTAGAAPSLARRIRQRLQAEFDEAFEDWLRLLSEVRRVIRQRVVSPGRRRELLDQFGDWWWLERLRAEGVEAVRAEMLARVGDDSLGREG